MTDESWGTAVTVLRLAGQLVDGIQAGLARRGYGDVRPAHGFAFVRIAGGDATTAGVAAHLGITKQAAAQLVGYLVEHGYVVRQADPRDARARLLALTDRGWACTAAAEAAARETVQEWRSQLGPVDYGRLQAGLTAVTKPGRLRPLW